SGDGSGATANIDLLPQNNPNTTVDAGELAIGASAGLVIANRQMSDTAATATVDDASLLFSGAAADGSPVTLDNNEV
ncbi:hypothetical protein, partial [Klebsiella pneumoniae]|uniref:hypothetical protein n=1 Tax=Klebsiella pneumoniae TaxID=573 RepID=UPI00272FD652